MLHNTYVLFVSYKSLKKIKKKFILVEFYVYSTQTNCDWNDLFMNPNKKKIFVTGRKYSKIKKKNGSIMRSNYWKRFDR